jgi:hypothetical protein
MRVNSYLTTATLALFAVVSSQKHNVQEDFVGKGHILVIKGNDYRAKSANEHLGCLDSTGDVTISNCGVFTKLSNSSSTSQPGGCMFTERGINCPAGESSVADLFNTIVRTSDIPSQ